MAYGRTLTALTGLSIVLFAAGMAQADDLSPQAVLNMSLQDLTNVEVTSVSKKVEKANEAAAAIFVITQEDIRRSGATNIPEALRMAPGINVAQAGAHGWAINFGSNSQFANKFLVLIDGRTVYSPLFSGTYWELQDTLLNDIDRIEVIRGPGATQWGANAVNGVINIITKNAKDTQGGLVTASAGNMIKSDDGTRYGVKIGDDSYARLYAKYNDDAPEYNVGTGRSGDGWHKNQGGFRSDSRLTDQDTLTVQGDLYKSIESTNHIYPSLASPPAVMTPDDVNASGANVLARWTRNISPQSSTTTQLYVDNTQYKTGFYSYNTLTSDFDFQHTWTGWERNEIIWGAGYRLVVDHTSPTTLFSLAPTERNTSLYSAFLQDKYTLHPDDLFLTLGSKFEHNAFSGFEVQPTARLSWLISDTQMAWGSVSRAVHTPDRFTSDGQLTLAVLPGPIPITNVSNPRLDSEELVAYELGYRVQPTKTVSLDIATFYNDYSKLFLSDFGNNFPAESPTNNYAAHSLGYEITAKVDAMKNWQLAGSYGYLDLHFNNQITGVLYSAIGQQPKNTFNVRSTYLFPYNIEMTNSLYYVNGFSVSDIPGYYRFDTKLSYEVMKGVEVSLVGQNLLTAYHREFGPFLYQAPVEIGRSVYGNITWKF